MVSETARQHLYEKLNEVLGTEGAATLMALLPEFPADELARREDLERLESRLNVKIDGLRAEMQAGFARVDLRFSEMEGRFAQVDQRFAQVDQRFAQVDQRFAQVDQRFAETHLLFAGLESRLARFQSRLWIMIFTNIATAISIVGAVVAALHSA